MAATLGWVTGNSITHFAALRQIEFDPILRSSFILSSAPKS
jgi:hypothetical protein